MTTTNTLSKTTTPRQYSHARELVTGWGFLYLVSAVYALLTLLIVRMVLVTHAATASTSTALLCAIVYAGLVVFAFGSLELVMAQPGRMRKVLATNCLGLTAAALCMLAVHLLEPYPVLGVLQYLAYAAGAHLALVAAIRYFLRAVT